MLPVLPPPSSFLLLPPHTSSMPPPLPPSPSLPPPLPPLILSLCCFLSSHRHSHRCLSFQQPSNKWARGAQSSGFVRQLTRPDASANACVFVRQRRKEAGGVEKRERKAATQEHVRCRLCLEFADPGVVGEFDVEGACVEVEVEGACVEGVGTRCSCTKVPGAGTRGTYSRYLEKVPAVDTESRYREWVPRVGSWSRYLEQIPRVGISRAAKTTHVSSSPSPYLRALSPSRASLSEPRSSIRLGVRHLHLLLTHA
eukprot:3935134-Rhodomonas_salina.1